MVFRLLVFGAFFCFVGSALLYSQEPNKFGILKIDNSFFSEAEKIKLEVYAYRTLGTESVSELGLEKNEKIKLFPGKNILPVGRYHLFYLCPGYLNSADSIKLRQSETPQEFELIEVTAGRDLSVRLELTPIAAEIKLTTKEPKYDLYYQGKKILSVSNLAPNRHSEHTIILNQFPSGYQQCLLLTSNQYAFINFLAPRGSQISVKPVFYSWHDQIILSGILGLLPGLNYFVHFPDSGAGPILATALFFHFGLTSFILAQTGNLQFLSPDRAPVANTLLLVGMGVLSILHAILSYSGAYVDIIGTLERASHLQITF